MQAHRIHRGFTLIELLAVVTIVGLLATIVLPRFADQDDAKVSSAARELTADLLYARSCAVATGRTHYIVFNARHGKYALMDSLDPASVILHPIQRTPFEISFAGGPLAGVTISQVSFDGQFVLAFDAAGTPLACEQNSQDLSPMTSGTVLLTSGRCVRTIVVEPFSGEIKVR